MKLDKINESLEIKGWFFQENLISNELCQDLLKKYFYTADQESFVEAKIGKKNKTNNVMIRKSSIQWIEGWNDCPSLEHINNLFHKILISTRNYFRIPLKRFESQFAIYNIGGFYKIHLDQLKNTRHRQITCCLYLNDCVAGGELILYKKGSKIEIETIIKPSKGTMVLFFSADIYHEVKTAHAARYSITTWFRDDEILPFV